MNSNSKAEDQEERIHTLAELVIDNDEEGRDEVDELIHPDFISAMEALAELQKEGNLSQETMKEVNKLYKKHLEIERNDQKETADA